MGTIADRLRNLIQETKNRKVIDIATLHAAMKKSEADLASIKSPEEMGADIDPAHAVYASVQNLFSVLAENLSMLKLLDQYTAKIEKIMEMYEPGYPPMSPVTNAFFSFWAHFDFTFGTEKETMGTCILDVADILKLREDVTVLMRNFQASRMGIYVHRGTTGDGRVVLEEIFTRKSFRCHSGSGYQGEAGEIWFVRIVPPPLGMVDYHVVITTPYIVGGTNEAAWAAYFERTIPRFGIDPPVSAYVELMKYGVVPEYWNEYIVQAYSNYRNDAVLLYGIPDKPESLPHFDPASTFYINLATVRTEKERRMLRRQAAKRMKRKR